MIVEVYRDAGDMPGAAIDAPMLSDDALIHRGRAELDAHAHAVYDVDMDIVCLPSLRLGHLLDTLDVSTNRHLRGRVTGISIQITNTDITTQIKMEAPIE
jgi:hypothetical protein